MAVVARFGPPGSGSEALAVALRTDPVRACPSGAGRKPPVASRKPARVESPGMKIVIAGGSGFLGRALSERLVATGHQVLVLTRGGGPGRPWEGPRSAATWTPNGSAGDWASAIDGCDAVANLAGTSIGDGRWTRSRKVEILNSRVNATRSLVAVIRDLKNPPSVLVSSSAQGYYGDRGDEELGEDAAASRDFLAGVCVRWEAEARKAADKCRVVTLRTGIVLAADGGALPRMMLPFRLFAGGPFGSGRQFMSWIHLDDWVSIARLALTDERVQGPINLCAPNPVRNREFAAALGRALRRPSWVRTPGLALRVALGEMAQPLLLASTRMVPAVALSCGYRFRYPDVAQTLEAALQSGSERIH
jgi:uncharacterized protein